MSRSSGSRGQVEPFAALVAVLALATGLVVYAGALDDAVPGASDRNVARPVLEEVERRLERAGLVRPSLVAALNVSGPDGYRVNVTLETPTDRFGVGPPAPPVAEAASEPVNVRLAPARVRRGLLLVRVWT